MFQLRCTGKVIKELGLKPNQLEAIKKPDSILGDWYVNIATIDRRKILLFVNERTLLSFLVYGIKKSNIQKIHSVFLNSLCQLLELEEVDEKVIQGIIQEYSAMEYTKTDSRAILGNMNDLMFLYKDHIYCDGGLKMCNVGDIISKVNRTPQKNIGWSYSIDLAKEICQKNFRT